LDQDRSQWDQELVVEGLKLLELSAMGSELTEYHVEAAIAAIHARALRTEDTNWETIVSLYDTLMTIGASTPESVSSSLLLAIAATPEHKLLV
jgi:predicted RNA polymerase sigma factor